MVVATRTDLLHFVEDLQKVHEPTTHLEHLLISPLTSPLTPPLASRLTSPLTFPPVPDLLFVQI